MIIFETDRLLVRPYRLTEKDQENFFRLNSDPEIMQYIRPVQSREDCNNFLQQIIDDYLANPLTGRWAVEEKDTLRFVGSFAFIPIKGTTKMQLGYALMKSEWGKGYATELTLRGVEYVFIKAGLSVIYAITEVPNLASQKVLLKSGFRVHEQRIEEGKGILEFILNKNLPD
ncbi:MAG: GNAT family N-acetyltransferase [Terrimonas sp.]|nr:GNAT family N-acetyltransferase [Terrimonas sp.]